jgi:hypothetical protein
MPKTTTFEHGGRIYEVRAIPTLNGWMVRIFIDGKQPLWCGRVQAQMKPLDRTARCY